MWTFVVRRYFDGSSYERLRDDCGNKAKLTTIRFQYLGVNANDLGSLRHLLPQNPDGTQKQPDSKLTISSPGPNNVPVVVSVTPSTLAVSQTSVPVGGFFDMTGTFAADLVVVLSSGGLSWTVRFHTSCSVPLAVGDTYGSLRITAVANTLGCSAGVFGTGSTQDNAEILNPDVSGSGSGDAIWDDDLDSGSGSDSGSGVDDESGSAFSDDVLGSDGIVTPPPQIDDFGGIIANPACSFSETCTDACGCVALPHLVHACARAARRRPLHCMCARITVLLRHRTVLLAPPPWPCNRDAVGTTATTLPGRGIRVAAGQR
jgi:hypothetical protein